MMNYFTGHGADGAAIDFHDQHGVHYDRERSVHGVFRQRAQANPDAPAVLFGAQSLTYGELDRLSDALAVHLVKRGISPGEVVALFLPRSLEAIVAKLAILKSGAVYLPLDPAFPANHLRYVLGECSPRVIFTDGSHVEHVRELPEHGAAVIDLESLLHELVEDATVTLPEVDGADVAYIMYTSGSTGRPKGVAVSHRGIARLVLDQNYIHISPADAVLHAATISFDAATFEVWSALLNGAVLIGVRKPTLSVGDLCKVVRENNVTVALLTTGMFNLLADFALEPLPSLRQVLFGGEAASAAHVRRFQAILPGCQLTNAYGPTECSVIATTFAVPEGFHDRELPIGKPIERTRVVILDEHMSPLEPGAVGELALAGDGLAVGYVHRPDLTAEKFVVIETPDGPLRCYLTGDLAVMGEDGTLFFRGRSDRQIKINGKRIELDEIETVIRNDPHVLDGVVACHTQGSITRIVAYLRPKDPTGLDDPDFIPAFMERLREILPAYMIPSAAMVMPELPLTPAGKIDRAKLPPPAGGGSDLEAPQDDYEALLARLWQNALGLDEIPLNRNFFDLGGTSLQLLRVHAGLTAELGRDLDVFVLFKHPTVRELAAFLEGKTANPAPTISADQRAARHHRRLSQFRRSAS